MDKTEALNRCMKLCSTKEYAPGEIIEKITGWGLSADDAEFIVKELEAEKFIDEFRYARYFVNDKIKFNKWGRIKVSIMLKHKGVSAEAMREAMDQINYDFYVAVLTDEIIKKHKTLKVSDPYILRGKLFQFAVGRGFEGDLIHKVIDQILKKR